MTSSTGVSIDLKASEKNTRQLVPEPNSNPICKHRFQVVRFRTGEFGNGHEQALPDDIFLAHCLFSMTYSFALSA